MFSKTLNTSKIFTSNDKDFERLSRTFGNTSVLISKDEPDFNSKTPILIVGWERVKKYFPNQKIKEKVIKNNISWTYDSGENKSVFKKESMAFAKKNINEFFEVPFISYDYILDGEFVKFVKDNIERDKKYYAYFHKQACYLYGGKKIIVIGLKSLEYVGKDYKKIISNVIDNIECIPFSYNNLEGFLELDNIKKLVSLENIYWTKFDTELKYNDIKTFFHHRDIHRFMPFIMSLMDKYKLEEDEKKSCIRQAERDIITSWLSTRKMFFDKEFKPDRTVNIKWENYKKYSKSRYSNKRAVSGRIYCVSGFNPQIVPKVSEIRKQMISRYTGGKIVSFDYISFETKLSLYFSKNEEFVAQYKDKDLHLEIAKVIYKKDIISEEERAIGKSINHAIVYGGGDTTLMGLLKNITNKKEVLNNVKLFLKPILDVVEYTNSLNDELGYLISNFGTIVRPTKKYAAYNNYIQLTASEIVVDKLYEIREFIKDKKIHLLFQIHDSFIFDFHPSELQHVKKLKELLQNYKGFSFQIKHKIGKNFFECN